MNVRAKANARLIESQQQLNEQICDCASRMAAYVEVLMEGAHGPQISEGKQVLYASRNGAAGIGAGKTPALVAPVPDALWTAANFARLRDVARELHGLRVTSDGRGRIYLSVDNAL